MAGVMELTLERDGHDQPWGFRLQGGYDVGMPLSVQRVLVGTPADGLLKKGDILLKISQTDARGLSHQQAADLFTNTGNQIFIQFMRPGAQTQSANAQPAKAPIAGGVALPGMTTKSPGRSPDTLLANLPKSRGGTNYYSSTNQQSTSAPLSLTIQNQPYRTSPLVQPTAKVDVGPGSAGHLKKQAEYICGAKEPLYNMTTKATDFSMKQKVRGTPSIMQIVSGSEGKVRGLDLNSSKISMLGSRFGSTIKDMLKPSSSRLSDLDKPKKKFIDMNLLKKKNYDEIDTNNNRFKFGGETVALKKAPVKPKKPVERFKLPPNRKPLRRVDPRLLIRKKPKLRQKAREYGPEKAPEYDKTELKDLNFKVEKTKLEKYERKKIIVKKVKREKYVKEHIKKYKPETAPKEKKKKEPPAPVKVPWKRLEPKKEPKTDPTPAPKVFKAKAKRAEEKKRRFIKFEVKTSRLEEYDDEITLLTPAQEALKFKGREDPTASFTINLNQRPNNDNSVGNINCESIDVYETIKI